MTLRMRRLLFTGVPLVVLCSLTILFIVMLIKLDAKTNFFIAILSLLTIPLFLLIVMVSNYNSEVREKKRIIQELIDKEKNEEFPGIVASKIEVASRKRELMMVNSRGRSVFLFWTGIVLIGLSLV